MKANEAPEIIHTSLVSDRIRKKKPNSDEYDEYIRTDAFIEKAAEWLSKHAKKYYFNKEKYLGTDELVEDFKIAMKL